jgi:hypothetical protein
MRRGALICAAAGALLPGLAAGAPAEVAGNANVHAAAHWCGHVRGRGHGRDVRFHVRAVHGHLSCRRARHVIRYVVRHGHESQASVGRAPSGWSCGWGYGIYHHDRAQYGRSGPICTRGRKTAQGFGPGFGPAPKS